MTARDELLITEFDPFKDFIAIYCKRNGKPEIIVQDLDEQKYSKLILSRLLLHETAKRCIDLI